MTERFDVAVIGAGIIGLGAAYSAIQRGLSVVVVDRTADQIGASVRNFGHLCIGAQSGLARDYADTSRAIWVRLAAEAGFWLRSSGTIVAARHDDEMELLRAAAQTGGIEMLDPEEVERHATVSEGLVAGGALIQPDLQTDPRTAAAAIRRHLEFLGVDFRLRTSVGGVRSGAINTSRGTIEADLVVVAVNHDLDQLLPALAETAGVQRCGLDMLRIEVDGVSLHAPLLTGWSLVRYGRFATLPEADIVRRRLHRERPDLAALDLNQMYTQLPDGSIIVGDTHTKGTAIPPFQPEPDARLLLEEFEALFGTAPRVVERWQGVYASGPDDFLVAEPEPGVMVLTATTGIGMTTGLGLAETTLAPRLDQLSHTSLEGTLR